MPFARTDKLKMYYELHGHGEPLLLIAGIGGDHNVWSNHLPTLRELFKCLVFDNRGVGQTDKPEGDYSSIIMAEDTAALMDAIGIGNAHVVGVSMGGIIAQELAIHYPHKVKSLVLASSWAKMDIFLTKIFEFWIHLAQRIGMAATYTDALLWSFTPAFFESNPGFFTEVLNTVPEDPVFVDAFIRQAKACINHDARDRLDRIQTRTLILVGDQDILTHSRFAIPLQNEIPDTQLSLLEGCPHAFHLEKPEVFNTAILSFLRTD
jgi:3-oxoadipate enol-lactonase